MDRILADLQPLINLIKTMMSLVLPESGRPVNKKPR